MSEFMRNEELDALVRELNRSTPAAPASPPRPPEAVPVETDVARPHVREGDPLEKVLTEIVRRDATDLVLVPGSAPVLRVAGQLRILDSAPLDEERSGRRSRRTSRLRRGGRSRTPAPRTSRSA